MNSPFIRAHGYVPGPTERPLATGALAALVAVCPAVAVAWIGGGFSEAGGTLGVDAKAIAAAFTMVMVAAGAVYGWIFMRAANDRRGGWLFGASYGFLGWMLGPAVFLQWIIGRPVAIGVAAQALLGAHLLYGAVLGICFPFVSARFIKRPE